jgi:hypothetical protein
MSRPRSAPTLLTTAGAAAIIFACTVGEDAHVDEDDGPFDPDSALLVDSRDHLAVCLQVDATLAADTARLADQLHADLMSLRAAHTDWRAAGLDAGEVRVTIGCPGGPVPLDRIDDKGTGGAVVGPGLRTAPTPYRTYVHVIPDATASAILGDRLYGRAIAELAVVDDHRVAEISTALVIRASAIGTPEFRSGALAESVGLRPQ